MNYLTLISTSDLRTHLYNPNLIILDCRFDLNDPELGFSKYRENHIPGAIYANLNRDLSSPIISGKTGRHPLPEITALSDIFSKWGITANTQVIAYDDRGGAIAARLWWLLKWLGHQKVAVLDGGFPKWKAENLPTDNSIVTPKTKQFSPQPNEDLITSIKEVEKFITDQAICLVDSRTPERYSGKEEPIDPIAGHIPGAINLPFIDNLNEDGIFKSQKELSERFSEIAEHFPSNEITFYCGSGVTASHNILAMYHAGYNMPKLFPGSWSEWITNPDRPIESSGN